MEGMDINAIITDLNKALRALDEACEMIVDATDSCPWKLEGYYLGCSNACDNDAALCWQRYFLNKRG